MGKEDRLMSNRRNVIIAALLAGLVGFAIVALIVRNRAEEPAPAAAASSQSTAPDSRSAAPEPTNAAPTNNAAANSSRQTAPGNDARSAPQKKEDEALTFFEEMIGAEDTEKTPSGEPRNLWTTLINVTSG